jgi:hypothetical protein
MWVEVLGFKNSLSKDEHLRHLPWLNENGGVQAFHSPRVKLEAKSFKHNNVDLSSGGEG